MNLVLILQYFNLMCEFKIFSLESIDFLAFLKLIFYSILFLYDKWFYELV